MKSTIATKKMFPPIKNAHKLFFKSTGFPNKKNTNVENKVNQKYGTYRLIKFFFISLRILLVEPTVSL